MSMTGSTSKGVEEQHSVTGADAWPGFIIKTRIAIKHFLAITEFDRLGKDLSSGMFHFVGAQQLLG